MTVLRAAGLIRDINDFPKPGIVFKDITPILADAQAMREVVAELASRAAELNPDLVVGVESRGFILGMPVAMQLGIGFVPIRKAGKLPFDTVGEEYALEYGTAAIEIHQDSVQPGQRVLLLDDLLATGGTAAAAARLITRLGGVVSSIGFLIELSFLSGRQALAGHEVYSLIQID